MASSLSVVTVNCTERKIDDVMPRHNLPVASKTLHKIALAAEKRRTLPEDIVLLVVCGIQEVVLWY